MLVILTTLAGCERSVEPRLLVLSPEVARVLVDLEVVGTVAGADDRSRAFPELAHAKSLGKLEERNVERARALGPTLVLALARDPERRFAAALAAGGVRIELFEPRSMDEVIAAMQRLGTLVGEPERADRLAYRTVLDITRIAVRRDGKQRRVVAWIIDRDPLTVVGGTGLLHQVLELAGAENALHNTADERVVLDESRLTSLRRDTILDSTAAETRPACADGTMICIAPDVAAIPAFDVKRRVQILFDRLYPEPK